MTVFVLSCVQRQGSAADAGDAAVAAAEPHGQGLRLRAEGRRHPRDRRSLPRLREDASAGKPGSAPSVRFWSRNGNEKTPQFPDIVDAIAHVAEEDQGADRARRRDRRARRGHAARGIPAAAASHSRHRARLQFEESRSCRPINSRRRSSPSICCATATTTCAACRSPSGASASRRCSRNTSRPSSDLVRLTPQSIGDGNALMKQANEENWEGLMVKLARSPYRTAKRSPEWIKHKLNKQDEFVVVGWTESRRHARAFWIADPRRARQGTACATPAKSAPASRPRSSSAS